MKNIIFLKNIKATSVIILLLIVPYSSFAQVSNLTRTLLEEFEELQHSIKLDLSSQYDDLCSSQTKKRMSAEEKRWQRAGFGNPEIISIENEVYRDIKPPKGDFTHGIDVDVVVLRGTKWNRQNIVEKYKKAAEILAQCNFKMTSIRAIFVDPLSEGKLKGRRDFKLGAPTILRYRDSKNDPWVEKIKHTTGCKLLQKFPHYNDARLINIHIRNIQNGHAGMSAVCGKWKGLPGPRRQWISEYAISAFDPYGIVTPHEMVHTLTHNPGHVWAKAGPNLMHTTMDKAKSGKLSNYQCKEVRTMHTGVKKL